MTLSVAIVGAGPAGFYTAESLIEAVYDIEIDIIERLPTPFGLIRAGVAPDHQSTKQISRKFEQTALRRAVHFYGNVEVGDEITLDHLRKIYDAVVLAVGSPCDRPLGIRGEEKIAVYGSSVFVGWYNAHPDFHDLSPQVRTARAVVIGHGNVALDVARILLKSSQELVTSDIPDEVAEALDRSGITDVYLVGRRGAGDVKFSLPELREMGQIADCDLIVDPADLPVRDRAAIKPERRSAERSLRTLCDIAASGRNDAGKRLWFRFNLAPVEIVGDAAARAVRFERTRIDGQRVIGTGQYETIECGLVIAAVGYRMAPIAGVPFDVTRGLIINDGGRIDKGLYVVGWAKRGPVGVIASNKPDGSQCTGHIIEDLLPAHVAAKPGRAGFLKLLQERGIKPVTFDDWRRIDAAEIARAVKPAPRKKFATLREMLQTVSTA